MALRILVSSASKVVRHSAPKMLRPSTKTGQQLLKKYGMATNARCCITRTCPSCKPLATNARCCTTRTCPTCKPPQHQFSTSTSTLAESKAPLEVPHDLDGLTGQAKAEIEAFHEGYTDPWDWDPQDRGVGTKENPIMVPTMLDERVVGCMCEGVDGCDPTFILLTWDEPEQRCFECGNVYKLVERAVYDKIKEFDGEDHYPPHGHH